MALIKARHRYRWLNVGQFMLISALVGVPYALITVPHLEENPVFHSVKALALSLALGASLGVAEEFVLMSRERRWQFLFMFLARTLLFMALITFWLLLVVSIQEMYLKNIDIQVAFQRYTAAGTFENDFIFASFFSLFLSFLLQVGKLFSPGVLFNFVLGRYHQPKEVDRLFMFVDIKSSTTIAEQLGNLKFSAFLQDFFADITEPIIQTRGEVYQYVGDEVVLTWKMELGLEYANCLTCFELMQEKIFQLRHKYRIKYNGLVPEFKAGLHGGPVVVSWVGEIKKELVYHGDVLNTAARIMGECNNLGKVFLVSGDVLQRVTGPREFQVEPMGDFALRGKENPVDLYAVSWPDMEHEPRQIHREITPDAAMSSDF